MKILLVQTSFLGDTILSTPVIAALKQLYPQAELWMMTTAAARALVQNDPLLSGVIVFDKHGKERGLAGLWRKAKEIRQMRFDVVYSLHRSYRTAIVLALAGIPKRIAFKNARLGFLYHERLERPPESHDVVRNLALLSAEAKQGGAQDQLETFFEAELRLFIDENQSWPKALSVFEELNKPVAALFPGSAWKTKMWKSEGFRDVGQYLSQNGFQVVLLGAPDERAICEEVAVNSPFLNLAGRTSIAETLRIVKLASVVVCNDSMALHMASAFKIPTVTIFCATSPAFGFGPWRNRAEVVEKKGLSCKPCRRHGSSRCPNNTEACMRDLSSQDVIAALSRILLPETRLKVVT